MTHLVPLFAGWSLWRWIGLRGAGFPADHVRELASGDASGALDRLLDRDRDLAAARARAIAAVERDLESRTDRAERRSLVTALRRLRADGVPEALPWFAADALDAIAVVRTASTDRASARDAAATVVATERTRIGGCIRTRARDPRFREALQWQNRNAIQNALDVLLRQPDGAQDSKTRQHEQLIANYLQRYCVKNDTIGFFGPVGWATIAPRATPISVRPGSMFLAQRTVTFEHWGIDALATSLAADPALRAHLAPRRHPNVWLDGQVLHHPIDRTSELPLEFARVLAACDGASSARSIAEKLIEDGDLDLSGPDEVYDLLDELVSQRAAIWTLEVPPHVEHPDRALVEQLETIDPDAAKSALAVVAELAEARDAIARAAGDAAALDVAFAHLETTFTRHTDVAALRRAGQTYAGRTLVYEDCRRGIDVELDPSTLARVSEPLSLLLSIARWFTSVIAERYREALSTIYRELAKEHGSTLDFLRFWERASDLFVGKPPPIIGAATAELQTRWARLVGLDGSRAPVELASSSLAPKLASLFDAAGPGWPSARLHSPDLMIAARDVDAIARGELVAVLGEFHVACANLAPWMLRQHPAPEEVLAALEHDRRIPIVDAVVSKERATRADPYSLVARDFDLELGGTRSRRPRDQVLEAGSLVVEAVAGALHVRSRDGAQRFALEQILDWFLSNETSPQFKLVSSARHIPRVSIDGLVVTREAWSFEGAELDFARVDDPLERWLATRRWASDHGLPRLVFYRIPDERKPCYLDFESPLFVEQLAHQVRKSSTLQVSEMLPTLDEAWLPDRAGARYTSEFRMVAVDPTPWSPLPTLTLAEPTH